MSTEITARQIEIVSYTAGATGSDDPERGLADVPPTVAIMEAGLAAVLQTFPDANVFEIATAVKRSEERDRSQADLMRRVLDEAKRSQAWREGAERVRAGGGR
jgi:hypothetical protein